MSYHQSSFYRCLKGIILFTGAFLVLFSFMAQRAYAQNEQKVSVGGTIEVAAQHSRRKYDDSSQPTEKENDIVLATVEVGIEADIHPSVHGHVLLLWEEDETEDLHDFLDEATITISNPEKCPYYIRAGKMYLPFGSFETSFITDSMTLELGEINETALQIGYKKENTDISFGVFNGDKDETEKDNKVNCYFANLGINYSEGEYNASLGISYLSNMADIDGFEEVIDTETVEMDEYVQGMGVFLKADTGALFLSAEYLGAIENFEPDIFGDSIRPETYNIELGWRSPQKILAALKYEKSKDMEINHAVKEDFNFPKKRYGLTLSYPIFDKATLGLEYLREKYTCVDNGKNDIITAQLAIQF